MSFQRYLTLILRVPGAFGETKISYLSHTLIEQNVGDLEVPVYDALLR